MKTLIVIFLFILILMSCTKEKTWCWQCETFNLITNQVDHTVRECDKTEDEIAAEEVHHVGDSYYYFCRKDSK